MLKGEKGWWELWSDGSLNQEKNAAGGAAMIYHSSLGLVGQDMRCRNLPASSTTAEMIAMKIGLMKLVELKEQIAKRRSKLLIVIDSKALWELLRGSILEGVIRTDMYDIFQLLKECANLFKGIIVLHIFSHAKIAKNEEVDKLAEQACFLAPERVSRNGKNLCRK